MDDDANFDRDKLSQQLLKAYARDLEAEEDAQNQRSFGVKKYLVFAVLMAVASFGGYAWYNDGIAITSADVQNIPLVKADLTPVKVVPKDRGGMHIPNQDKLVYNNIEDKDKWQLPKVERVMPPPEEAVDPKTFKPKVTEVTKDTKALGIKPKAVVTPTASKIEGQQFSPYDGSLIQDEVAKKSAKAKPKTITVVDMTDIKERDIKPLPEKRKKPAVKAPKKAGGLWVQLGAFRSQAEADKRWRDLQKTFAVELEGLGQQVQRADLGNKGVFFRLRVGPLEHKTAAKDLCQKLIEKKQGCFVALK